MNDLRKLGSAFALTLLLGASVMAETPCAPGQTETMPCSSVQLAPDDPASPGQMETPPAADGIVEYAITETAIGVLQSVLSLF